MVTFSNPFLTSKIDFNELPREYVVKKFYELGYYSQYNRGDDTYSCSCPICLEGSAGVGNNKRCFYYPKTNIIYCFRCGWSSRPIKWIREVGQITNAEIEQELKENDYGYISLDDETNNNLTNFNPFSESDDLPKDAIDLCSKIQMNYYNDNKNINSILNYLNKRRLLTACNRPKHWYTSLTDHLHHDRLIIPYYDENNKVIFYQSRAINDNNIRYLSKKNGIKTVFNINNIDYSKKLYYIFEGPFDSCFIKNGVAIGGITLGKDKFTGLQSKQINNILGLDRVWILDSQYLDEAAFTKSKILLEEGEAIFLWPEKLGKRFKDFNELSMAYKKDEIDEKLVIDNMIYGKSGILKLMRIA